MPASTSAGASSSHQTLQSCGTSSTSHRCGRETRQQAGARAAGSHTQQLSAVVLCWSMGRMICAAAALGAGLTCSTAVAACCQGWYVSISLGNEWAGVVGPSSRISPSSSLGLCSFAATATLAGLGPSTPECFTTVCCLPSLPLLLQIHASAEALQLITFDADGTLYADGHHFEQDNEMIQLFLSLMKVREWQEDAQHSYSTAC